MHYADKINWKLTLNAHKGSGGIINLSSLQHEAQAEQINRLCPAQQLPPAQHADTEEKDVFGPAYIPSARQTNSPELPLYTANAVLQTPESDKPISQKSADNEPSQAEQAQLAKLQQRDAKVKAHEQAHVRAAGGQAGTPTYTYQTGPDGQKYAIGGSVNISIISNGDDESGLRQAKTAQRTALINGEASSVDQQTADKAEEIEARVRQNAIDQYAKQQNASGMFS